MRNDVQGSITELDLSDRLRRLMRDHDLTVAGLAEVAGVSKSAMEKYLSGPSSPRATALASICYELGANLQWLLFGVPDDDLRIIHSAFENVLVDILNELKQGGEISDPFNNYEFGTKDWRLFTWELSEQRAREALERIVAVREKARKGMKAATLDTLPLRTESDG